MVNIPVDTRLAGMTPFEANAFIVVVVLAVTGALYCAEARVGVVPSRV